MPDAAPPPDYAFLVRPIPPGKKGRPPFVLWDVPPYLRLRRLLKTMKRVYGFECVNYKTVARPPKKGTDHAEDAKDTAEGTQEGRQGPVPPAAGEKNGEG